MNSIVNTCILLSALFLFGFAFIKICILDVKFTVQKLASILFILASTSFAGKIILPREVNMLWLKIATLSLIIGVILWVIGDKRTATRDRRRVI